MNKPLMLLFLIPWLCCRVEAGGEEALEKELAEARTELAAAARRMAEVQRKLAAEHGARAHFRSAPAMVFEGEADDRRYSILFHPQTTPRRSWIGVILGEDEDGAGVPVMGLTPGGPALKAGLERGDRILAVNGQHLGANGGARIRDLLGEIEPGDSIVLEVDRAGNRLEFEVETAAPGKRLGIELEGLRELLGEGAGAFRARILRGDEDAPLSLFDLPGAGLLPPALVLGHGTDLVANHDGLTAYFGTGEGVLVVRIADDNPLGLKSGDVIVRINDQPVSRPVDVGRSLMRLEPDSEVTLDIVREGRDERLEGRIPERRLDRIGGLGFRGSTR